MRKENEFGNVYHQMNFSPEDLNYLKELIKWDIESIWEGGEGMLVTATHILDRIEKELGIE